MDNIRHMFYPGAVYLLRGICNYTVVGRPKVTGTAYKIGATSQDPQKRIYMSRSEVWQFQENLELLHTIAVDNMRVVELMFHRRLHNYAIAQDRHSEWFFLQGRKHIVTRYCSIDVAHALRDLAGSDDTHNWWKSMPRAERLAVAVNLWKHPLIRTATHW